MGDKSGIQWTDATWNPSTGCTRVSAGCDNCYAFQLHDQRHEAWKSGRWPEAPAQYHRPFSEVQLIPERLTLPLRWTKPRRIFVDSMSDLFHADVPDHFVAAVFAVMAGAPQHTFQILTKRPRRMERLLNDRQFQTGVEELYRTAPELEYAGAWPRWPLPNVWLGTSVENQEAAYRIDWLVKTPAAVRFLSCEPLLGPLDIGNWTGYPATPSEREIMAEFFEAFGPLPDTSMNAQIGRDQDAVRQNLWVIVGGESGPGHRAVDPEWVRGLRDHCVGLDIPFFFKQWGGRTAKAGGRELDGRTWDEMPAVAS